MTHDSSYTFLKRGTINFPWAVIALLVSLGWAGNFFRLPILNADFIFGSVFALLALQFFGWGRGVLAGALIASYTFVAWNHPWAVVTMTTEIAAVGLLVRRTRINLVTADALYWLVAGIPVGFFCFHVLGDFPVNSTLFLMTKQSINGITNALIARLLFMIYARFFQTLRISFRELLFNCLALFVLCTALLFVVISGRSDLKETDRAIRETLRHTTIQTKDSLDLWIEERRHPVVHLAEMARDLSAQHMQARLEQARASDANFLRMALIDQKGITTAYAPAVNDRGESNIGRNYSDRPYLPALKDSLQPMLSEVIVSRSTQPEPVAIMLAPIIRRGQYDGAVGGIINFNRIQAILEISAGKESLFFTLLDRNGNAILSNRKDQETMKPFSRGPGKAEPAEDGIVRWIPALPPNMPSIEYWGLTTYVTESAIGPMGEWMLLLELPVAPFQKMLYQRYRDKFLMLFAVLLAALAAAQLLSRRIVYPIERLSLVTKDLPARLSREQDDFLQTSSVSEVQRLIVNFEAMADELRARFSEIRLLNESLEDLVRQRTEDLRKSEESLAITLYSIADAVIATDTQGLVTRMNASAERMTGWSFEEAEGRPLADIFHIVNANTRAQVVSPAIQVIQTGKAAEMANHTVLIGRDGTEYQIADSAAPIRDNDGTIRGVILIFSDVTKRYEAEKEKEKLREQLAQAQKMESVGRLAGGVAHDFNNMLAVILGHSETAMDDIAPGSSLQASLEEINKAAQRSADLTRQLLAFARKQAVEPKVLHLNDVVEGMLRMLRRLIGEDIHLRWMPGTNLWLVRVDPSQIDQILANLSVNARDAIAGGGTISLTTENIHIDDVYCFDHPDCKPGDYVLLTFSDTGIGMDKDTLSHLFEPFFTTKKTGEGTGLGLATVYGIVKQNGGIINVYSEIGKGTTFRIYLPRHEASGSETEELTAGPLRQTGDETILLVEDEPAMLAMTMLVLEKLGYRVFGTRSPKEAIRLADEHKDHIDLLITDVIMPDMNGRDLAQALRIAHPHLKFLFMSGYTSDVIAHHGVLDEGIAFIQKPFTRQGLAARVRDALDKKT